jgi:hypothetical protein
MRIRVFSLTRKIHGFSGLKSLIHFLDSPCILDSPISLKKSPGIFTSREMEVINKLKRVSTKHAILALPAFSLMQK